MPGANTDPCFVQSLTKSNIQILHQSPWLFNHLNFKFSICSWKEQVVQSLTKQSIQILHQSPWLFNHINLKIPMELYDPSSSSTSSPISCSDRWCSKGAKHPISCSDSNGVV